MTSTVIILVLGCSTALAQTTEDSRWRNGRYEAWIGVHSWPGIGDLSPLQGGFDQTGFGLGGSAHWPVKDFANSRLLVGVDLGLFSNESDVSFIQDEVTSRGAYLAPSAKWQFGRYRQFSLDAGLGFYTIDVAEVLSVGGGFLETELWEDSTTGLYLGGTWNIGTGFVRQSHGLMVALKVHMFELDPVRDEIGVLPPTLGQGAEALSGPVYMLQLGYRWR